MKKIILILSVLIIQQSALFAQSALQVQLGANIKYVVAKDGSGNYTTLQAAVDACASNSTTRQLIYVKPGTYVEKVEIPSNKPNLLIVGENAATTIVSYNDYSGSGKIYNGIISSAAGGAIGTSTSHTMYVAAPDFTMMNITVKNTAGDIGQAVALNCNGDRHFLYHCKLVGYQDTYYTWGAGRFYIKDCYVEGAIDYIFGRGVALFDSCQIHSMRSNSYITAAATDQNFAYGYLFRNCKLTAGSGYSSVYLGRPWKAYAQTVFLDCEEGSFLNAAGWYQWSSAPSNSNTCYYAEYGNCGAGSATSGRVSWSRQLTAAQAANYTMDKLFAKTVNPSNYAANWTPATETDAVYRVIKNATTRFVTTACFITTPSCSASVLDGGATTFCQGGSVVLNASAGAAYQWFKDGATIQGATSQTFTATSTGAYSAKVSSASGCSATSSSIPVTVNPIPAAPVVTDTVTYKMNDQPVPLAAIGTDLVWYTAETGGAGITTAPVPSTVAAGVVNYHVSQTTNSCESPRASIAVIVSPAVQKISLITGWNLIGCPLTGSTDLNKALSSIWSNVETVKGLDAFYTATNQPFLNSLTKVVWGQGYLVKVTANCELDWIMR